MKVLRCNFAKKNSKTIFESDFDFIKKHNSTWKIDAFKYVDSTSDTLKKFSLKNWRVVKTLVGRLTRNENFGSKTVSYSSFFFLRLILFKEALNCHLWKFYCVILQKKIRKWVLQQILIFIKKHNSTWKLDAL